MTFGRRRFLGGLGAAALGCGAGARPAPPAGSGVPPRGAVPTGTFHVRGAYVLPLEPGAPDVPDGEVVVQDGRIAAIGRRLAPPAGATVVDARGQVLLPGFVDTHAHLWLMPMLGLFGRGEASRYFPLTETLGAAYRPEDMGVGTAYGAALQLLGGITGSVAHSDNVQRLADAEAAVAALAESGLRARYLYGPHDGMAATDAIDMDAVASLVASAPVEVGLGWRTPSADDPAAWQVALTELGRAREMGIPIATHVSGDNGPAQLRALIARDLLGRDMEVVHATRAQPDELRAIAASGAALSLTPITEHRVGFGLTRAAHYALAGDRIGLGTDGALGGEPDMFAVMRLFHSVQVADTGELSLRPREVLELATLGGARALGWAAETGSLAVGKRADLVLLDGADFPALGLGEDPTAWLLYGAGREDVRTVWVDGVPRVHEAELVEGSLDALRDRARATIAAVHHTGTE
ncbi:MAG: hydrolase [Sandaracinus sp.]|nr:hydrolase [Sandaracinus sp.]